MREAIKNTGVVFDALNERGDQLADWIANSNDGAAHDRATATPSSRASSARSRHSSTSPPRRCIALEAYAENTKPVLDKQLHPGGARSCRNVFESSEPLALELQAVLHRPEARSPTPRSRACRPRSSSSTTTRDLLVQLDPFLRNLNPFLEYLGHLQARDRGAVRQRHRDAPGHRPDRQQPRALPAPDLAR